MKRVTVLGATGSIGASTLDVLGRNPEHFAVQALAANSSVSAMLDACCRFRPPKAVLRDPEAARELEAGLRSAGLSGIAVQSGDQALQAVATDPDADQVVAGMVGAAGMEPTLEAVRAGKTVLLANKECLVLAGALFMAEAQRCGATVIPVDSEHNAIFQVFPGEAQRAGMTGIQLTASGGPFREREPADLVNVTPEEAVAHPNWSMGRKISVDSATMMNKALEVIEARWLFDLDPEAIQVVIHPESIIHSMVDYRDGSVLAQMGYPDMRTPIAAALAHPDRIMSGVAPIRLADMATLTFQAPDPARFPALSHAYRALREAGTTPAILNAANEIAVEAFLEKELDFPGISRVIETVLDGVTPGPADTLEAARAADAQARELAQRAITHPSA